jgi:hypothetical protein
MRISFLIQPLANLFDFTLRLGISFLTFGLAEGERSDSLFLLCGWADFGYYAGLLLWLNVLVGGRILDTGEFNVVVFIRKVVKSRFTLRTTPFVGLFDLHFGRVLLG